MATARVLRRREASASVGAPAAMKRPRAPPMIWSRSVPLIVSGNSLSQTASQVSWTSASIGHASRRLPASSTMANGSIELPSACVRQVLLLPTCWTSRCSTFHSNCAAGSPPIGLVRAAPWNAERPMKRASMPGCACAIGTTGVSPTSCRRRQLMKVNAAPASHAMCRVKAKKSANGRTPHSG